MTATEDARAALLRAIANTSPGDEGVYVTISDLEAVLHPALPTDESCNHGECAWQDGCTLKRCPAITTVSGDPWHGCSLPSGHSGDHDFSVRLYGGYPEFGIATPPTDDERGALLDLISDALFDWDGDTRPASRITEYVLASDLWRNRRQGPITDAQYIAARDAYEAASSGHVVTEVAMRAALEAALSTKPVEYEYTAHPELTYTYNSYVRVRDFHPEPEKIWRRRKAGEWEEVPQ